MQLAAMVKAGGTPKGHKTVRQKLDQMDAARDLEKVWHKDEILEAYLNLITFRGELQGIAVASRGLFDKEPSGLDDRESYVLAALIRSPNTLPTEVGRRLCSDSSRSYPGRSAPLCISQERRGAVKVAVMEQKSAEAIVDKDSTTHGGVVAGNEPD